MFHRAFTRSLLAMLVFVAGAAAAYAATTPPSLWGPGASTSTTSSAPATTTSTTPTTTTPSRSGPGGSTPREADGARLLFTTPYYRNGRMYLPVSCRRSGRHLCRLDVRLRFDHRGKALRRRLRIRGGHRSAIVVPMRSRRYCATHVIGVDTFIVGTDRRTSSRDVGMAETRGVCR